MRSWGCPKCGTLASRVVDSGQDAEGVRVRLRRCMACATRWATEERPIDPDAFYARCPDRSSPYRQRGPRRCPKCGVLYPAGKAAKHRQTNRHADAIAERKAAYVEAKVADGTRAMYEKLRRGRRRTEQNLQAVAR